MATYILFCIFFQFQNRFMGSYSEDMAFSLSQIQIQDLGITADTPNIHPRQPMQETPDNMPANHGNMQGVHDNMQGIHGNLQTIHGNVQAIHGHMEAIHAYNWHMHLFDGTGGEEL
nr:uncharacterized protein LOC131796173 [Pocillopora verrucosa]